MTQGKTGGTATYEPSGPVWASPVKTRQHLDKDGNRRRIKMSGLRGGRWVAQQVGGHFRIGLVADVGGEHGIDLRLVTTTRETGKVFDMGIYLGGQMKLYAASMTEIPVQVRAAIRAYAKELGATDLGYPG